MRLSTTSGGRFLRWSTMLALALSFSPLARADIEHAEVYVGKFSAPGAGMTVLEIYNPFPGTLIHTETITIPAGRPRNANEIAQLMANALALTLPPLPPGYNVAYPNGQKKNSFIILNTTKNNAQLTLRVGALQIHTAVPAPTPGVHSFHYANSVVQQVNGNTWRAGVLNFNFLPH